MAVNQILFLLEKLSKLLIYCSIIASAVEEIWIFAQKHKDMLHHRTNIGAIQLLDNSEAEDKKGKNLRVTKNHSNV